MFDYETKPSLFDTIKIGRITFGVFTALEWWLFGYLLFSHPANKSEGLMGMLLGMIMLILAGILSVIGVIAILYSRYIAQPGRFWQAAAILAVLPVALLFLTAIFH